jgi:predicted nucleotidyltransferase
MNISPEICGLKQDTIAAIQSVFAACKSVSRVILYGSRAKSSFKPGSDIDLTIVGDNLSLKDLLTIEGALDDLLLPYKFDLSLYESIENEELLNHIQRVGLVFYERQAI